jgi:hypothetical protein
MPQRVCKSLWRLDIVVVATLSLQGGASLGGVCKLVLVIMTRMVVVNLSTIRFASNQDA